MTAADLTTTGFDLPEARRPGLGAWWQMFLAETKMVVRDTAGLLVPIGLPLILMVTQGFGTSQQELPDFGGRSVLEVYVLPITLVMVITMVGVVNLPSFLAGHRKSGMLKRLAATPAHPAMVLVSQVLVGVVQSAIGIGLALGVTTAAFGLQGPENLPASIGVLTLIAAAMYATGMLIGALVPTTNAAIAVGLVAFLGIGATGGMFGGADNLPTAMAQVGEWLPFGAGRAALEAAWLGHQEVETAHLLALAIAVVLGSAAAIRFFRWSK